MTIGILKESGQETRVSLLPEHIKLLKKRNFQVLVETNAGAKAYAPDEAYKASKAQVLSREEVIQKADILLLISGANEVGNISSKIWVGQYNPLHKREIIDWSTAGNHSVFSLDLLPRTTRAQNMDVLSSQANIAGYQAVLIAATHYPRYFPMFMTAAGSIPPAKVLVLGAGVAGLQAIATARRLGAVVEVFDTRPQVKEEVMSLGAKFIEVEGAADASNAGGYAVEQSEEFKQRQKQKIAEAIAKTDIVITTAQIPGKPAPLLVTEEMLNTMKPGSVIVDLAAATGGNTSHTQNGETIVYNQVTIIGDSSLPSRMPFDASKVYGKNICNFLELITDTEGNIHLNFEDELVSGACLCHEGKLVNQRVQSILGI